MEHWRRHLGVSKAQMQQLRRPILGLHRILRGLLNHLACKEGCYRLAEMGEDLKVGYTTVVNAGRRPNESLRNNSLRSEIAKWPK